ncbi:hypothetical protein BSG1_01870 [Bacillus sp. SG-1]|nr:hypothetical protein BSG1_01870 [Bacillus sp. SG-1]
MNYVSFPTSSTKDLNNDVGIEALFIHHLIRHTGLMYELWLFYYIIYKGIE